MFNQKEYHKAYRQAHKEEIKEYNKAYMKAYYQAHKEVMKARRKEWALKNREKMRSYTRAYRLRNLEKVRLAHKTWFDKNKDRRDIIGKIRIRNYTNKHQNEIKPKLKCEECDGLENLQNHHINYTYNPDDVKIMCRKCHDKLKRIDIEV